MPLLDISGDTSMLLSEHNRSSLGMELTQGPRRLLCCIRLPNTCPECLSHAFKSDSDNKMVCLECGAIWCWTCRKRIDKSNLGEQHYEWYNVFGCPGLRFTPNYFLIGLAAKVLVSLFFPVVLFFAPLVVAMANYKPGANIVKDQAKRFKNQVPVRLHSNVAKTISLFGFSLLGLAAAAIFVPILSPIGILYQLLTALYLLIKGVCCSGEVLDAEELLASEYDSPNKHTYLTLASAGSKHSSWSLEPKKLNTAQPFSTY
mmetsp:Transcript_23139/g.30835  ORF Transcript_23139/g.30835 Transcript_23139/m.30835 type:complete len:259 (+) Transcript_23139:822-1598(+)